MAADLVSQTTLPTDISDIKTSIGILIDATEANHQLLTQILAACSGDGSGLLVEALNQLAHEVKATREAVVGRRL